MGSCTDNVLAALSEGAALIAHFCFSAVAYADGGFAWVVVVSVANL